MFEQLITGKLLKLLLPWMQIYDNGKYGQHLPIFTGVLDSCLAILNIEKQLHSNTQNVNNINQVRANVHHHGDRKKHGKGKHVDCSLS